MNLIVETPPSAQQVFQDKLLPDEMILWAGQPEQRVVLNALDYLLIPLGLILAWVSIPGPSSIDSIPYIDPGYYLCGIAWFIAALFILFGRLKYKSWRNQHSYFAVTDKRVMSAMLGKRSYFRAADISSLTKFWKGGSTRARYIAFLSIQVRTFNQNYPLVLLYFPAVGTGLDIFIPSSLIPHSALMFYDIPEVDKVYSLLFTEDAFADPDPLPADHMTTTPFSNQQFSKSPRRMSLDDMVRTMSGGGSALGGWILFGLGLFFFWTLTVHSDFVTPLFWFGARTTTGKISDVSTTSYLEDGADRGNYILAYSYCYSTPEGRARKGTSYVPMNVAQYSDHGGEYRPKVRYLSYRPSISRLDGMRGSPYSALDGTFVALIPLLGLWWILWVVVGSTKSLLLMRNGKLALGYLKSGHMSSSGSHLLSYAFVLEDGITYEKAVETEHADEKRFILYYPGHPERAVILDSISGEPQLDESGNIYLSEPPSCSPVCMLAIPTVVLILHGWYAYTHFLK